MNEERTDDTDEQKASGSGYGRPFIDGLFGKNGHHHHHDGGDNDDDYDGNHHNNGCGNDDHHRSDHDGNHHHDPGMVDPGL